MDQLAGELERLLGADGGLQAAKQQQMQKAAGGGDDGAFWSSGAANTKQSHQSKKLKNDGEEATGGDQPASGWARRIRGLLFVIMRELVKALDGVLKAAGESAEPQVRLLLF